MLFSLLLLSVTLLCLLSVTCLCWFLLTPIQLGIVDAFFCQQSLIGVIFTFFGPSLIIDLLIPTK
jgi:hypothetical protein